MPIMPNFHEREMHNILQMQFIVSNITLTDTLAPSPLLVATVNSTLKDDWKACPMIAAGHATVGVDFS
jgi:threonine/homoserine/homoserine lactone efflux protein